VHFVALVEENQYPMSNGCGVNDERSCNEWELLHIYWIPSAY